MGILEQMQEQGWYITEPGLEKLLEGEKNGTSGSPDVKQIVKLALHTDLREYGGGALSSLTARGTKADAFEGSGVVQLVKLRNLGAPKVNEESKVAPRLLKLTITDGQSQYIALEHEHIPSLSLNTPPGTKILLKNGPIRILQGVMMLTEKNVQVLGGHVTALVEKWELSRTMAKYAKGGRLQFSAAGPPPWIPFGQKIQQPAVANDKDFKSLQPKEKEESTENSAFTALRNDAIAEATKSGTKKTFGGGAKQMVDANVQKIMDKGFTEEQANHALKLTRNNVHRALSNLQRIEDRKTQADSAAGGGKTDDRKPGGKRGFGKRDADLELQSKPSGKVSLFDFFGDILQDNETAASGASSNAGGRKTSKESTPHEKDLNRARSDSAGRHTNNNRHQGSQNQSSSNRAQPDVSGNNNAATGLVNGGGSKNYNQRFENNISSSFANRNTTLPSSGGTGRGDRGRGDQQHQGQGQYGTAHSQQRDQQSNYKQADYYGSTGGTGRYRGGNENQSSSSTHTGGSSSNPSTGSGSRGGNSRANDSKYNQQHPSSGGSGYNHNSHQQRQDGYNNNSSGTGGGKYGAGGGKQQSNNGPSYGNNSNYSSEGRNQHQQSQHGQTANDGRVSGGSGKSSSGTQNAAPQHQQSSYGNTSKQTNYNNQQQSSASYNSNAANGNNSSHGQYNQSTGTGNHGNNYNATGSKNSSKGGRYGGKDESLKYPGAGGSQNTIASSQQNKKGPSKAHGSQQHPNAAQSNSSDHPQSSYGSSGGGKQNANAANKVHQVSEQLGGMQISDSKSTGHNASGNRNTSASNTSGSSTQAHKSVSMKQTNPNNHPSAVQQQHAPQIASPSGVLPTMPSPSPGGPSPVAPVSSSPGVGTGSNATQSVPKNLIQLPNGYNYNPYQIMGFQNKQTNEFALNVLKSQQQYDPMQQPPHLGAPGPAAVPPTVSPVGPNVVPMGPNVAPAGVLTQTLPQPPPASIIGNVTSPGHGSIAASGMAMAPAIAPNAAMSTVFPNWKIGDRCLAKYWEDGGFYTAEITDTSKNTFVVHFLEYGNYEEVLKTDCIPIAQATSPVAPAPMSLGYHPAPATAHMPPPNQQAAPVQYASHPGHLHHPHQHHHGHVPPHHPPPMTAAPGPYQDVSHGAAHGHYAPFKTGPMPPVANTPLQTSPGQGPLASAMNQFQPAQHHLHHVPVQQQHQQQHHSQQQPQPQGGHISQHHHQSQMPPHAQQRAVGKFRERPMYVPPAQRK
ncbi:uncharacterized protein LOC128720079 [Anopheles nili]|uniref:uncharacterized protein LOC128720079 n=1 Tax=Anopheles nili TaxID=185578 RepID=UPI00237C1568|nr:uncharacterized protein LOC128720079 [Anopheles nili]